MSQLPLEAKKSLIFDLFLSQEQKELRATKELYTVVRRSFENSSLAKEDAATEMAQAVVLAIYQVIKRELEATLIASAAYKAAHNLIRNEELFDLPAVDFSNKTLTYQEQWELRNTLRAKERILLDTEKNLDRWYKHAHGGLGVVFLHLPESAFADQGGGTFTVRLVDLLDNPVAVVESIQSVLLDEASPLEKTKKQLWDNVYRISQSKDKLIKPADLKNKSDDEIVEAYLYGTPLLEFLHTPLPFPVPYESRFEHALICAGSGWGKTQTLQRFIYDDVTNSKSVCVIDSQGDLIRNILKLREKNDVVLIDPTDIDHPPCLNMFDVKLSDDPVERERILNGTVELYQYLFGGLLGAELTMKQGALFGFIARLLISIPGATIHTLIDLMEHGERYREHINRLTGTGRRFFETQFFHRKFSATKDQIISRLYGVLGIPTLDRIFSHKQNKVNFFEAMNSGKIILINTAAGFLGQEGCSIFGRFFIAMLLQAALRRSETAIQERKPCFLYIDEAYQYFDEQMETLFNQARKYRLGITIACLHLDQFPVRLRSSVMTSTAIKLAGGLNASDEHIFAASLRVEKETLQSVRKYPDASEFVCSVRNVTDHAVKVTVPFFAMELAPELSDNEMKRLLDANREQYCARWEEEEEVVPVIPPERKEAPTVQREPVPQEAAGSDLAQQPTKPLPSPLPKLAPPPTVSPHISPEPIGEQGKGGRQHKYLQQLLKQVAEGYGFLATIEKQILRGEGSVDLSLEKQDISIACEISVTSTPEHELHNVEKCFAAGFQEVILLAPEKKRLDKLRTYIFSELSEKKKAKVQFFLPDDFLSYLEDRESKQQKEETTVRGYKVKVKYQALDEEQQQARKQAIADVIVKSMKRMKETT